MIAQTLWGEPKPRHNPDPRKRAARALQEELAEQALRVVGDPELARWVACLASRVPTAMVEVFLGDALAIKRLAEIAANMAEPPKPPTLDELILVAEEALRIVQRMKEESHDVRA
jgi:hypothetical protein